MNWRKIEESNLLLVSQRHVSTVLAPMGQPSFLVRATGIEPVPLRRQRSVVAAGLCPELDGTARFEPALVGLTIPRTACYATSQKWWTVNAVAFLSRL